MYLKIIMLRVFEFFTALLLLLVSLPVWIVISMLFKLESKGPVFFVQKRIGLKGRPFDMIKFRSMDYQVNPYERSPADSNDPRITKIGKKIRDSGLDELPQLINVLKGEMVLVGPRPEMAFIARNYTALQRKRLLVKPGITGLWQIMAPLNRPIHENIKCDLYYIKKKSFLLDCWIVLNTLPLLFGCKKRKNPAWNKTTSTC